MIYFYHYQVYENPFVVLLKNHEHLGIDYVYLCSVYCLYDLMWYVIVVDRFYFDHLIYFLNVQLLYVAAVTVADLKAFDLVIFHLIEVICKLENCIQIYEYYNNKNIYRKSYLDLLIRLSFVRAICR